MSTLRPATATAVALVALLLLGACGSGEDGSSAPREPERGAETDAVRGSDELGEASGRPCPRVLHEADREAGADEAAEELPELPEVGRAWVCRYDATESDGGAGDRTAYGWERAGRAVPVDDADLAPLGDALASLALPDLDPSERICTADLGPRWMVVLADDGDLTGVVVDDFGCHDTRLTGDPHAVAPGVAGQDGVVGGVLQGGSEVLRTLGVGRAG